MADTARMLADFLRSAPSAKPALPFFDRTLEAAREPGSVAFRAAYAGAARRLGPAGAAPPERAPDVSGARSHWSLVDWVRLALLANALERTAEDEQPAAVQALFEGGEIGEQESLLRTLGALPGPERLLETGLLGCRTNAARVFEAIGCENAYPARYFPELGFNQMVLKAIFIEVPVRRIEGLFERRTGELLRMVQGYASERRAAGRPVPGDVDFILGGGRS